MNLVKNYMTWSMMLVVTVKTIQGSMGALTSEDQYLGVARHKRFLNNPCTFSTFKTLCKFSCKDIGVYIVCFTATLKNRAIPEIADVEIEGNVNGLQLFWQLIGRRSDPNPPPQCSVNTCMVLYQVNPETLSACIRLNDKETNATLAEVGCFRTSLFDTTTAQVNAGETTSHITDTATGNTKDSGTLCRKKRSGDGQECITMSSVVTTDGSTTPDGQGVNGGSVIGTTLMTTLLMLSILTFI